MFASRFPVRALRVSVTFLALMIAANLSLRGSVGMDGFGQPNSLTVSINELGDSDWNVRYKAVVAIQKMGADAKLALPALIDALDDENSSVLHVAALAVGEFGAEAKHAMPKLLKLLNDRSTYLANPAAMAIGKIGGPETKLAVRRVVQLDSVSKRCKVNLLLSGYLHAFPEMTVPHLMELIKDELAAVRARSAEMLGTLPTLKLDETPFLDKIKTTPEEIRTALLPALQDDEITVRVKAAVAVARLTPKQSEPATSVIAAAVINGHLDPYTAVELLVSTAKKAMPLLVDSLNNKSDDVQYRVAYAMAGSAEAALPLLLRAAQHESPRMRAGAILALGETRRHEQCKDVANRALATALGDQDEEVRLRAAELLVYGQATQAAESVAALAEILRSEKVVRRRRAANTLAELGPAAKPSTPALLETLKDSIRDVRLDAAAALLKIDSEQRFATFPVLEETMRSEDDTSPPQKRRVIMLIRELSNLARPLVPALNATLEEPLSDKNLAMQLDIAATIGRIDPENSSVAVKKLIEIMTPCESIDWWEQREAIQALGQLRSRARSAVPALLELASDSKSRVALNAAVAALQIDLMRAQPAWEKVRKVLTQAKPAESAYCSRRQQLRIVLDGLQSLGADAEQVLPELIGLLSNPSSPDLEKTIAVVASAGPRAKVALPVLKKLQDHQQQHVRAAAAAAVARITGAMSVAG